MYYHFDVHTNIAYLPEVDSINCKLNVIICKCSTRLYSGEHFYFLRRKSAPIPRTLAYCNRRRTRAASTTIELEMSGIRYLYIHADLQGFDLESFLSLSDLTNTLSDAISFLNSLAVYLKSGRSLKKIDGFVGEPMSLFSFCTHWTSIRKYIVFSWKRALDYIVLTDEQKLNLIVAMMRIKEELDSLSSSLPESLGLRVLRESETRQMYYYLGHCSFLSFLFLINYFNFILNKGRGIKYLIKYCIIYRARAA